MMVVGHQKILNFLNKSLEKGSLSHAYIFSGPESLGKFKIALDFAQKLTGDNLEINPDIIIIRPEIKTNKGISREEDIKMEKIRELQHQLSMTSYAGKYKVAIIDRAEKMNKAAQNAILKTLEEPMDNIILILITGNFEKILPTITSRCVIKKFSLVSDDEIEKIIPSGFKLKKEAVFWSLGRPGLAKGFLENPKELEYRREAEKELVYLFSLNVSDKFILAEKMSKDIQASIEKLNWWIVLLRESLMGKNVLFAQNPEKLLHITDKIEKSIDLMRDTNSNSRLILENLFLEI